MDTRQHTIFHGISYSWDAHLPNRKKSSLVAAEVRSSRLEKTLVVWNLRVVYHHWVLLCCLCRKVHGLIRSAAARTWDQPWAQHRSWPVRGTSAVNYANNVDLLQMASTDRFTSAIPAPVKPKCRQNRSRKALRSFFTFKTQQKQVTIESTKIQIVASTRTPYSREEDKQPAQPTTSWSRLDGSNSRHYEQESTIGVQHSCQKNKIKGL